MKKHVSDILAVIGCLGLGMLSGYVAHSGDTVWYQSLVKPSYTPPSWIFSPVWTLLYIMMGLALSKMMKLKEYKSLLFLFFVQFFYNLIWSYLFFRLHRVDIALLDLSLLWLVLVALLAKVYKHKNIFMLLFPYIVWTSFALVLNAHIYQLN